MNIPPQPVSLRQPNASASLVFLPITHPDNKICYLLKKRFFTYVRMVGSCNGLLFFACFSSSEANSCLCFWNPATDKFSDKFWFGRDYFLSYCFSSFYSLKLSFGYDSSSDTYKVVALHPETAEVQVFSSGKNAWRNIQQFPVTPHFRSNDGVYLSRSVNWIVIRNNLDTVYNSWLISIEQFVIISLDLSTETYTQLLLPPDFDEVPVFEPTLCVLMNSLCFCHKSKHTHFVICQMKEFGVQESWTQYLKISYDNFLTYYDSSLVGSRWFPLYLSENGDTLIWSHNKGRQAIIYNRKDNRVERSRLADKYRSLGAKDHVESLVSYC